MTASPRRRVVPEFAPETRLLDPVDDLAWQASARCAETDPEIFFPEKGGTTREAKKVCASCTVRTECLEYALEHDDRFGVWGGLSERERRKLTRQAARNDTATKVCPGCGTPKPLKDFHRQSTKPDGHGTYCKICSLPENRKDRAAAQPTRRRVTVSQFEQVRARHTAGETLVVIADEMGVSDSYLSRLLSGALMPAPDPVADNAAASTAADLGTSQQQPGRLLAGSRHSVPDQNQEEAA